MRRRVCFCVSFRNNTVKQAQSSSRATSQSQRFGKDHLMFADWPIGVSTFQQARKADGTRIDFAEHVIERRDGTRQRVTLEAPSTIGLPTAGDDDVLIALMAFARRAEFASDIVRFVPLQLLRMMRLTAAKKNYERIRLALKRLCAVTVTYQSTWFDRETRRIEPLLITGILAEAKVVCRRGRSPADAVPESYVQWTRNVFESLRNGNLTDLDLDIYFNWTRPGAKHLFRHLNKVWHAGRKPRTYERDLRELACAHVGMTECKDLKRNFHAVIQELEEKRYLLPVDKTVRYRKVRPGVWRVRLELHPDHVRGRTAQEGESSVRRVETPGRQEAATLVREYQRHRFQVESTPTARDIQHAEKLIERADSAVLRALAPAVAEKVETSFRGKDCHFGAAVRFFELALEEQADKRRLKARHEEAKAGYAERQTALDTQQHEKKRIRQQRLAAWKKLSDAQRSAYFVRAIEIASSTTRSRLSRSHDLTHPATEVLAVMAADHGDSTAESS